MTTAKQRTRALERANKVRAARADIKRRLAAGTLDPGRILDPDRFGHSAAGGIPIGQLLEAIPGIGPITAGELLEDAGVPSDRRLDAVDERTRRDLAAAIEEAR